MKPILLLALFPLLYAASPQSLTQRPLPLRFEPAASPAGGAFVARAIGYSAYLAPDSLLIRSGTHKNGNAIAMKLLGANQNASYETGTLLPGASNYFLGSTRRIGVPAYARIEYRDIYPSINIAYYGTQQRIEHDFIIAPGGNLASVRLAFSGIRRKFVSRSDGDLVLVTSGGDLRLFRPKAYQEIGGRRMDRAATYIIDAAGHVGFRVADYDRHHKLIVDPVLRYSTYIGGAESESIQGLKTDSSGNIYLTGYTRSPDFPLTGPFQSKYGDLTDAFVMKLDPTGSSVIYATYIGGSGTDEANGIAVDSAGSAYITGETLSANFPTTPGAFQTSRRGPSDAFVVKLSPSGNELVYSTYLGGSTSAGGFFLQTFTGPKFHSWAVGSGSDLGAAIAVDASGATYVTGVTVCNDFPVKNALQRTNRGGTNVPMDAFLAKLDPTGSTLVYSTYLGGQGQEVGFDIAVDSSGSAYVAGTTSSSDFPTTSGVLKSTITESGCRGFPWPDDCSDAFVAKFSPDGSSLVFSTLVGGTTEDRGNALFLDDFGNIYIGGTTDSPDLPVLNAVQSTRNGTRLDAFVVKLDPTGSAVLYGTYLGGSATEGVRAIAVDSAGIIYLTGDTGSTDFPTSKDALQPANAGGNRDAFVAYLDPATGVLLYSSYLGGSDEDVGTGIAVVSGGVLLTGYTASTDFPAAGALIGSNAGKQDGFVALLAPDSASAAAYRADRTGR